MKLLVNALLPTLSVAFKRVNILFDEKIVKISADEIAVDDDVEMLDAKGMIILPGGIDPHVNILGSDTTAADDLSNLTKTAMEGGWTTLAELSYHTRSPIFTPTDLKNKTDLLNANAWTDMALWGHVDIGEYPYHAEAAQELWSKGVVGIALAAPAPNDAISEISFTEIMDLFLDIYESDTAFAFQGYDHENHAAYSFTAQMDAIKKILRRMQENPIHIPRVSSFPTIEFINTISKRSDISFAICVSDLMAMFDGETYAYDHECDFTEYIDLLYELLGTKKIYLLSNCSATPTEDADYCELFGGTKPEIFKYSYLWVLSELWKKRKVTLGTCIKMTSENAAKRLGIYPQKGCLEVGSDADFVLYDPETITKVKTAQGKQTELIGHFESVFLKGTQVAGNGMKPKRNGGYLARSTNPKRRHNNTTWI